MVRVLPLEDLLLLFVSELFPGYEEKGSCAFRVLRDSDMEVEDEAEDLVREFETALKRRRRGEVIRLKISAGAPQNLRRMIAYGRIPGYRDLTPSQERKLLDRGLNRVTDTCIPEEEAFRRLQHHVFRLWSQAQSAQDRFFPHEDREEKEELTI